MRSPVLSKLGSIGLLLTSKSCLVVVIASLSDGVVQFAYVSPPRSNQNVANLCGPAIDWALECAVHHNLGLGRHGKKSGKHRSLGQPALLLSQVKQALSVYISLLPDSGELGCSDWR